MNDIDSLRRKLSTITVDSIKVKVLLDIADGYRRINFDSLIFYASQAKSLASRTGHIYGEAKAYLTIGEASKNHGQMQESLVNCQIALQIAQDNGIMSIQALSLSCIGLIYNYQGNYPLALEFYQTALEIAEQLDDMAIDASILNNIGGIHYNLKDYRIALDYWEQTLDLYLKSGNTNSAGSSMNNIALAYSESGEFEKALQYFFKSLNSYPSELNCSKIYPMENIGNLYMKLGKTDSAEYYLTKALIGAEKCQDPIIEQGTLHELAELNLIMNNRQKAQSYLERALIIGEKGDFKRELRPVLLTLSSIHEKAGELKLALKYFKQYQALGDSLFNEENTKEIGRLEAKYEFEAAQREREVEQRIQELNAEKKLTKEKWIRNTFLAGFIIMIVIALFIYRNVQRKVRANKKLRVLNRAINKQQHKLQTQAKQLNNLNKSLNELNENLEKKIEERTIELEEKNKELELKNSKLADYAFMNAHKLRAPVATILGLIELFNNNNVDFTEKEHIVDKIKLSTSELDDVVKEIRRILEDEGLENELDQ